MTPIVDVFTAADHAHAAHQAAELRRLRAENTRLREVIAAYDARLDLLQRANEAKESHRFKPRQGVIA